ncbi:MAG: Asp-tRNA(Asn)/Glu-tRNA(Gln) amidotransferase subunit GatA [Candidatus Pacebacteria bacterium]|nr:Asp-tRNA(Asn)/Glu-tRNA(Gln) amidotransferase subunit GatA [Candidatus Paceibacterota bacterium]MCD8508054.1 Asp-tRNA(Asn)/Glu-tRNA(Gln) amidotransferase subunit GatA [Candidatus Paceibacterota bacterium]MCD8528286.1 Asp-tRNA(Asn)/Glu-tRNA(Gln) amidotransferase subunit GatA [Candidatus Paceibacterota bacterium]MCD8563975.1 Asp-tRNA(Asn)/Glu-tRNA(Gln) amidotransferase subunit GatA [Candidatus Paceibacterota bacterium]
MLKFSHIDSIEKLHQGYLSKDFTVREIIDDYLAHIAAVNPEMNAYLEIFDDIDDLVNRAEQMIASGDIHPLTGVPVAIKDNMLYKGKISSASSRMLEHHRATYNADVVDNLLTQGAIIIGRTNMDEFAMGSSTETSAFGITKNPRDMTRVPGGSSGGAAAALAMDGALISLGSDTGGSIRQPASFCGLVGLKPTYGSLSRSGLMAMASSLDIIGPLTKNVDDAERSFYALARHDENDSTSIPQSMRDAVTSRIPKKIGVPRSFLAQDGISEDVRLDFEKSLKLLEQAGYELVDIDMPLLEHALAIYYILMPAEVSSNLARFDGVRYGLRVEQDTLIDTYKESRTQGFGPEVQRRILLGTYVLSHGYYDAFYNKAMYLRGALEQAFKTLFADIDAFVTPTTPTGAFRFGEKRDNPLEMYMSDIFTVPANIAGVPALSVPSGQDSNGMPLGLHITAGYLQESVLFAIGKDFERMRDAQA